MATVPTDEQRARAIEMNRPMSPVVSPRPMSKTEAKRHLADAKRSISKAQQAMKPTPQSVLEALRAAALTDEQVKRIVSHHVREAEESLASLRRYLA